MKAIDRYLADGGNALFMLDPFIQTGLEPIVEEFGVVLDDDIVIDEASHFWTDVSAPAVTDYNRARNHARPAAHLLSRRALVVAYAAARARSVGQAAHQLLQESYAGTNPREGRIQSGEGQARAGHDHGGRQPQAGVRRACRGGAARAARREAGAGSRCAGRQGVEVHRQIARRVIGDSDFATNSFFHIMGNGKLFLNTVNYLASQENLIGIEPRTYDLPRVNLTNRQMKGTFFLSIVLIPALMALVGIAVWWRQR